MREKNSKIRRGDKAAAEGTGGPTPAGTTDGAIAGLSRELERMRTGFYELLRHAPVGYLTMDASGLVLDANPFADQLLQSEPGSLAGKPLATVLTPASRAAFLRRFREFLTESNPAPMVVDAPRPNGSCVSLRLQRQQAAPVDAPARHFLLALTEAGGLFPRDGRDEAARRLERLVEERTGELSRRIEESARTERALRESHEHLSMAFWAGDMFWWVWHIKEKWIEYSPRLGELFARGSTRMRHVEDSVLSQVHPDDLNMLRILYRDHAEGRTPVFEAQFRGRAADGEWHWLLARGRIVERDPKKGAMRMTGIAQNITGARRVMDERNLLFTSSADPLALLSLNDGVFRQVNPAWSRVLGWTPEAMQGKAAIGFTHPEDRDRGRALLEAAVQGQTVLDFQQRVLCADGGFRWLQCNCVPLPEQNLLVVIARDTTEEHAHSEELCRLNAELETRVAERTAALQEQVRLLEERERSLRLAEKQLGDALELAGFAHWSYDLDSEEVVFNDRMYAQLRTDAAREGGYRLDLERARTRFMAPEMAESMRGVLKEAIAGEDGAPRDLCIQVRLGDGSMGEISARIMVQADGSGRWRRVYGIGRVTPHLQA